MIERLGGYLAFSQGQTTTVYFGAQRGAGQRQFYINCAIAIAVSKRQALVLVTGLFIALLIFILLSSGTCWKKLGTS